MQVVSQGWRGCIRAACQSALLSQPPADTGCLPGDLWAGLWCKKSTLWWSRSWRSPLHPQRSYSGLRYCRCQKWSTINIRSNSLNSIHLKSLYRCVLRWQKQLTWLCPYQYNKTEVWWSRLQWRTWPESWRTGFLCQYIRLPWQLLLEGGGLRWDCHQWGNKCVLIYVITAY